MVKTSFEAASIANAELLAFVREPDVAVNL